MHIVLMLLNIGVTRYIQISKQARFDIYPILYDRFDFKLNIIYYFLWLLLCATYSNILWGEISLSVATNKNQKNC